MAAKKKETKKARAAKQKNIVRDSRKEKVKAAMQSATPRQKEVLEAYLEHGAAGAAAIIGIAQRNVYHHVNDAIKTMELKGFSPEHGVSQQPLPDYTYKRISTLRNANGDVNMQWQIQEPDKATRWTAMKEAVDNLVATKRPCATLDVSPRLIPIKELAVQYTITDYHFGMLAWYMEGGANWDVKIAKKTLVQTFKYLIEKSPAASTGIFANIGDFMHYDGWIPETPTSGHILDTESRFPKIVDAAVDAILECIELMLQKHEKVIVINMQGNHDLASSYWLQKLCQIHFKDNPRLQLQESNKVQIDRLILPYYAIQHGKTALFYHHGHRKNFKSQPRLYPAQFPKIWGDTEYRYGHTGHYHHTEVTEEYGIKVEMHNSMCAKDAYASHGGYFAERSANAIVYHTEHGEVGRQYVKPGMLL